jgi:hypothetical protein
MMRRRWRGSAPGVASSACRQDKPKEGFMLSSTRFAASLMASLFLVAALVSGCGEPGDGGGQPPPAAPVQ